MYYRLENFRGKVPFKLSFCMILMRKLTELRYIYQNHLLKLKSVIITCAN